MPENNDDKPGEVFKKGFYYHLEESYPKILSKRSSIFPAANLLVTTFLLLRNAYVCK